MGTEIRGCNKIMEQSTPGSQDYSIDDCMGQGKGGGFSSIQASIKAKAQVGRRGQFGTTTDRFHGFALAPRQEVDGGKYDPRSKHDSTKKELPDSMRSCFQSRKNRFAESTGPKDTDTVRLGKDTVPGPGDYRPETQVNYTNPYRNPKTDHLSFGSSHVSSRFDPRFIFHGEPVKLVPGPGEYDADHGRSKHVAESKGQRFAKDNGDYMKVGAGSTGPVGPGTYETGSSMMKKTFNVTTEQTVPIT